MLLCDRVTSGGSEQTMADTARRLRTSRHEADNSGVVDRQTAIQRNHPVASNILQLQRAAGNAAVRSLLQTPRAPDNDEATDANASRSSSGGRRFELPSTPMPLKAFIRRADADALPGTEDTETLNPDDVTSALTGSAGTAPIVDTGQTASLPDMVMPPSVDAQDTDAVAGALTYAPSITQSGTVSPFGATSWATFNLTGISVTSNPGSFAVQATIQNPITFNVASGGRTDLPSENDLSINSANYQTAASDLTPNMSDLNGRPLRTQFWAEDLTIRHEHFHAAERQTFGGQGVTTAQAWLNTQSASSVGDVQSLLTQVPGRVIGVSQAAMPFPAKEERAYGDGAPLYKARADAIQAKGDRGGYLPPDAGSTDLANQNPDTATA
jgi:hypothetical protein